MGAVEDAFRARQSTHDIGPIIRVKIQRVRQEIPLTASKLEEHGYPAFGTESWAARMGEYRGRREIIWMGPFSQLTKGSEPPYSFNSIAALRRAFGFFIDESDGGPAGKLLLTHDIEHVGREYPLFEDAELEDRSVFDSGTLDALLSFLGCLQAEEKTQVYQLPDVPRPDWW